MEIRRMLPSDVKQVATIEAEVFPDAYSERAIFEVLTSETAMCFTALSDGVPVAYLIGRLIAPEGEIYRIATAPEKRRRGIGYRLLDYSVKTARGDGLEALFLEVRASNAPAISLYEAYGFRRCGVRRGYYSEPKEDAVLMLLGNNTDLLNT